ncbi:MAG: hypothetical protein KAH18_05370 [Psychromonas sp.]|nr:hypothetical protein [Psychromonas sp.]
MKSYINEIIEKAANKKIISVDIFDTLLLRCANSEVTRFFKAATALKESSPELKIDRYKVFTTRHKAHHSLYALYHQGILSEPNIESIFNYQINLLKNKQLTLELFLDAETKIELESLSLNQPLLKALEVLSASSKIVLLSDMYLTSKFIKNILDAKNVNLKYDLHVSNEIKKSKAKGDAYPWLIDKYGVSPEDILHMGDNYNSDVLSADKFSISAIHTPRSEMFYFKQRFLNDRYDPKFRKYIDER